MTTKSKIIIAAGGLLFAVIAVVVGVVIYVAFDKEYARQYSAALAEGREFGKRVDQEGCIGAGLTRLQGVAEPSVSQLSVNDVFVRECLTASRSVPDFCEGVPSIPYSEWVAGKCERIGRADAACLGVFDAKHTFCNGL